MKIIFYLLTFLVAPSALAYQCERPARDVKDEFLAAGSTFVGKVIHVGQKTEGGRIPVRFSVDTIFRHKKAPRKTEKLELVVAFNTLDQGEFQCTKIEVAQTYLVYAFAEGKTLVTDVCVRGNLNRRCSRTRRLDTAKDDLEFLRLVRK